MEPTEAALSRDSRGRRPGRAGRGRGQGYADASPRAVAPDQLDETAAVHHTLGVEQLNEFRQQIERHRSRRRLELRRRLARSRRTRLSALVPIVEQAVQETVLRRLGGPLFGHWFAFHGVLSTSR